MSLFADVSGNRVAYYDRRPRAISWNLFFDGFSSFRDWLAGGRGQLKLGVAGIIPGWGLGAPLGASATTAWMRVSPSATTGNEPGSCVP